MNSGFCWTSPESSISLSQGRQQKMDDKLDPTGCNKKLKFQSHHSEQWFGSKTRFLVSIWWILQCDALYRLVRGNWKISCHRWNKPLFWSFCPTETHWMVLTSTCLRPRPWRNCTHKDIQCDANTTCTTKQLERKRCFLSHLQCVDARPDVIVCLLTQRHQSASVDLHPLPQWDLQTTVHINSYPWSGFAHIVHSCLFLCLLTSASLCASLEGWVWGNVRRKACCLRGLRAGT